MSVDTEEDNWVPAREDIRTDSTRELPRLQAFFDRLAFRATYFVAHSLTTQTAAARIIRDLHDSGRVEIGSHLHPWNTPPLDEEFVLRNTMLLNLPAALQQAKVERLTDDLEACLGGERPKAFRAGRWAFGRETIEVLLKCGYAVDSSVTPFTNWVTHGDGASHVGAPINPYRLDVGATVVNPVPGGRLIEMPLSFGFNRSPLERWSRVFQRLDSSRGRALFLDRMAARSGLLKLVTLSPETDSVEDMLKLTRALLASGAKHLHMYLHSPTLQPGLTPFTHTIAERDRLYSSLEEYMQRVTAFTNLRFATVSEAAAILEPQPTGGRLS
jgi:hypothetical protein